MTFYTKVYATDFCGNQTEPVLFVIPPTERFDFALPDGLETIEADAFCGIDAKSVRIPPSVTSIDGNPFAGSAIKVVLGEEGSAAEHFADLYGYYFFRWMN